MVLGWLIARRGRARSTPSQPVMIGTGALVGLIALLGGRRRRKRMKGMAATLSSTARSTPDYDDITLQHRVESELFREAHELKGQVSVNVAFGVVELRGEVSDDKRVAAMGKAAKGVAGVKDVHNLLHTPGSPAKHSPPSSPDEVRDRRDEATAGPAPGRFSRIAADSSTPTGARSGTPDTESTEPS